MSEIDQAFIKAYQEARATPPAKRPAAPLTSASTTSAAPQYANKTWRLDVPQATSNRDAQGNAQAAAEPTSHPRVPTPHLHFAARGAAWLERPQPQLVAAVAQEFVAEEYDDAVVDATSASDPWIVPTYTQPAVGGHVAGAPRAMSHGFGGPTSPKSSHTPSTPDAYAVYSGSIKPSAPPPSNPSPPSFPVRPSSGAPWSPTSHLGAAKKKSPASERIAQVEKHTEEMTQQLTSVAHTLAMLEGDEPTEICLAQKEVTLVIRDAEHDDAGLEQQIVETLDAKIAALAPQAKNPELKIAAMPVETIDESHEQFAEPNDVQIIETVEVIEAVAAKPKVKTIAKVEAAPLAEVAPPAPTPVAAEKFQPQWEVDQFQWPDVIDRLCQRAGDAIAAACAAIQATCDSGQKVLAITGVEESMGSTTLLMTLGRELAKSGMRVAIVDADFDRPTLAERTGLRIQHGWEATLTGSLPLEEVTVASLQDNVTLVPLVARQGVSSTMASLHAAKHLRRLREHFDVVLIDAGVGSENVAALATATADDALDIAVLLTVDQRRSQPAATSEMVGRLRHCGIQSIQLGETFVSA